jgi:hypothetical protein
VNVIRHEPVRTAFYGVLVAALAVLVSFGVIDDGQSATVAAFGAAVVLAVAEVTRRQVTPAENAEFLTAWLSEPGEDEEEETYFEGTDPTLEYEEVPEAPEVADHDVDPADAPAANPKQ